ncbi:MAG: gamma-glutamyltransferase [Candidatus Pacebacteria bacterium]|nr:gamma-glutamyltransferase [Candidatus Paceibacterota bacterium]
MNVKTSLNLQIVLIMIISIFAVFYLIQDKPEKIEEVVIDEKEEETKFEAIVSSNQLATEAGFEILSLGGTAADAAIAVAATLSVVEPWFSSVLGGGTWALYYESSSGKVTSIDGVGPVGSLATVSDYEKRGDIAGIHQSNVPGAWDGWMLWLEKYGKLDLEQVLSPAIRIAEEGYLISNDMERWLNNLSSLILSRPDSMAIYALDGKLIKAGDTVYQNNMAKTLRDLINAYNENIENGRSSAIQSARDYYYRGKIAEAIVDFSDRFNGYLTLDDFNNFESQIVEPISIKYNDKITVFENPPNSQGIVMLLGLNILKDYNFSEFEINDADVIHKQVEALKLAFADRHYYIGDPQRTEIPIDILLSDGYAKSQRERINMEKAMEWPISGGLENQDSNISHTTTFHIIDKYGNAAAVTTSLGAEFLVIGDTGIHINNRMRMISLEEDIPNRLTPGYKVRHTSNPYMALYEGKPYILGGNTGVDTQPQGQLQQFMSVVEFGLSAQEAINKPRFITTAFPAGTYPYNVNNVLQMENGFPSETIENLKSKGHNVTVGTGIFGSANMLVIDKDKEVQIGAESRGSSYGKIKEINN